MVEIAPASRLVVTTSPSPRYHNLPPLTFLLLPNTCWPAVVSEAAYLTADRKTHQIQVFDVLFQQFENLMECGFQGMPAILFINYNFIQVVQIIR
jgi:hypothetical protein